jgi:hypothetical protein
MNSGHQDFAHDIHAAADVEKKRPAQKSRSFVPEHPDYGKVFVGGLSPSTTVAMLREHFSQFGKLCGASVIKDPATKQSRGFGFVEYEAGMPPKLLQMEHIIDKRQCGVKPYTYEWSAALAKRLGLPPEEPAPRKGKGR